MRKISFEYFVKHPVKHSFKRDTASLKIKTNISGSMTSSKVTSNFDEPLIIKNESAKILYYMLLETPVKISQIIQNEMLLNW